MALLRKKLAELDAGGGNTRLVLSRHEIVEMLCEHPQRTEQEADT